MRTYQKPEIAILGSAAVLVQGSKTINNDASVGQLQTPDCELDD